MRLINVHERPDIPKILYDLLAEREPHQNISHRKMPTWEEHLAFIASRPYAHWFMIEDYGVPVGSIYLTKADEIGLFIFKARQGEGWGHRALAELMRLCPRPTYYANVSIFNSASQAFFIREGFEGVQITFRKDTDARP